MQPHRLPLSLIFVAASASAVFSHATQAWGAEPAAAPSAIALEYRAPTECPSADRVRRELQRLLSASRVSSRIESEIVVVERRGRFEVSLTLHSPVSGERTISHPRCALAVRAAALVVAIAIDPDVATREQARGADDADDFTDEPQPAEQQSTPNTSASDTPPAPRSNVNPEPRDDAPESWPTELPEPAGTRFPHRFAAQLGLLLERGLAPELSPGLFVGLGLQGRHWRASIVPAVLPKSEAINDVARVGARFVHVWVDLQLCARSGGETITAGVCALLRQTWAFASGIGADENLNASGSWQTFGAGPHVAVWLSQWLQLEAALNLEAPLQRPRFVIENLDAAVFRPDSLGGAGTLGAVVSF